MPAFAGIDHISLSVTDLDVSQQFYSEVLGFQFVVDFGYARFFIDRPSGFGLTLIRHAEGDGAPFTELHSGIDHIGLTAESRDELEAWERRLDEAGVTYTPIRDMPFGAHLNFRDPDNIPLEFMVPNAVWAEALQALQERDVSREEIDAFIAEHVGLTPAAG